MMSNNLAFATSSTISSGLIFAAVAFTIPIRFLVKVTPGADLLLLDKFAFGAPKILFRALCVTESMKFRILSIVLRSSSRSVVVGEYRTTKM